MTARTALDADDRALLEAGRVAHLATANSEAHPHVIPLCYAILDERTLVFAIDGKPKKAGRLRRLRNLDENPRFALVVDQWDEDWSRLAYVLVEGAGRALSEPERKREAIGRLRARYPQYVEMALDVGAELVELRVESVRRWRASG